MVSKVSCPRISPPSSYRVLLARGGHTDKLSVVLHPLLDLACLLFLFLLFGHSGSPASYFASTGQGSMGFTSKHAVGYFHGGQSLHTMLACSSLILWGEPARSTTWFSGARLWETSSGGPSPNQSPQGCVVPGCRQSCLLVAELRLPLPLLRRWSSERGRSGFAHVLTTCCL